MNLDRTVCPIPPQLRNSEATVSTTHQSVPRAASVRRTGWRCVVAVIEQAQDLKGFAVSHRGEGVSFPVK